LFSSLLVNILTYYRRFWADGQPKKPFKNKDLQKSFSLINQRLTVNPVFYSSYVPVRAL